MLDDAPAVQQKIKVSWVVTWLPERSQGMETGRETKIDSSDPDILMHHHLHCMKIRSLILGLVGLTSNLRLAILFH